MLAQTTHRPPCSALYELVQLANDKGYLVRDTSSEGHRSYTFGEANVFSLCVRFDKFWRVKNAIYNKGKSGRNDLFIRHGEKHKRDKVYWVLNFLPDNFAAWDKDFPPPGATPAGDA